MRVTQTPRLIDYAPRTDSLIEEALEGLQRQPKVLPCKWLYDQPGSELFDRICELPEYYPTRTEMGIMEAHGGAMVERIGADALLVELGSGSSTKTRILLDALAQPAGYVPIDISREHLLASAGRLASAYPHVEVLPVCADYLQPFELPKPSRDPARRVIYFPGSTIGNFHAPQARTFLQRMAQLAGEGGAMLIGVDLRKSEEILLPAYNDSQGVTAAFNLNLLARLNREADATFDLERFRHRATWNDIHGRVEMHLVSREAQIVRVAGRPIEFASGETIRTECSYKYTPEGFEELAADAGWRVTERWLDDGRLFSVQYLVAA